LYLFSKKGERWGRRRWLYKKYNVVCSISIEAVISVIEVYNILQVILADFNNSV
jgi:hypothetical protein